MDAYDIDEIDDQEFERMDPASRARAEAEMARRDAERARAAGRIPEAFLDGMCGRIPHSGERERERGGICSFLL